MEPKPDSDNENEHTEYYCSECNYKTTRKANFMRHLNSKQHMYKCEYCDRLYKHHSSLWKHKKTCECKDEYEMKLMMCEKRLLNELHNRNEESKISSNSSGNTDSTIDHDSNNNSVLNHSHHNAINTTNSSITNSHNTTNNTNNNTSFNLQFFLNDTCKDAMTLKQFGESIVITLEDLERTGTEGYVAGITHIINSKIKEIKQELRPMHCTDSKRQTFYVKITDETWEKENDEKNNLIKLIKYVSNQNSKKIIDWMKLYPDCTMSDSIKNDLYLKIVNESMNGNDDEECSKNFHRIILNVSKLSTINKKLFS